MEIGKTRNCVKTLRPSGCVSTQCLVFPISTSVDITVYQHGKSFMFLKDHTIHQQICFQPL